MCTSEHVCVKALGNRGDNDIMKGQSACRNSPAACGEVGIGGQQVSNWQELLHMHAGLHTLLIFPLFSTHLSSYNSLTASLISALLSCEPAFDSLPFCFFLVCLLHSDWMTLPFQPESGPILADFCRRDLNVFISPTNQ